MLDRGLAELYGVKAIRLWEHNEKEVKNMVSQNAIPSKQHLSGSLPFVCTEHGVLMLANVLKSE